MDYVPFNQGEYYRWLQDAGDQTLRLNYPLNENSTVIDAGGFHGNWAAAITEKYNCNILVFEPLSTYANQIRERLKGKKVLVVQAALSNKDEVVLMAPGGDASSIFIDGENKEEVQCVSVEDVMSRFSEVDLMKINIEGSEYDLLEAMIAYGLHTKVKNIQVQFHRFIEDCAERRDAIQSELAKTHKLTWHYDWIWENWERI